MSSIPGAIIFAFTVEGDKYHVIYDQVLAEGPGFNRVVAAIYKLMKENPDLIEQVLNVTIKASEELSNPFTDILNEKK